jgi:hypothetical protein
MTDHYSTDILAVSVFLKDVKKTVSIFIRCKKNSENFY